MRNRGPLVLVFGALTLPLILAGCTASPTTYSHSGDLAVGDLAVPGSMDMGTPADSGPGCSSVGRMKLCGGVCVDPSRDDKNCGACGAACGAGLHCVTGTCALVCPGGLSACGGGDGGPAMCVNRQTDNANCGACGVVCPMGNVCSQGKCALSCQAGLANCQGACANLMTDAQNCGKCGNACPGGNVCAMGACMLTCPQGQTACNGVCADPTSDAKNCGACGNACAMGQICVNRACILDCPMGTTACNKTCANLESDNGNCGQCGMNCPQGTQCAAGKCQLTCQPGQMVCNNSCVNPLSDNSNCGGCGLVCPMGNVCKAGKCMLTCPQGFTVCNNACANLQADVGNCGSCGKICPQGAVCSMGACGNVCNMPLESCNNVCVDPRFDPNNCGACHKVCGNVQNGSPACFNGACGIGACANGYRDCDGRTDDGCETQISTDVANCGACGKVCPAIANGTPACANGACGVGACNQGHGDCDNNPGDGCESDLGGDANNCGQCGVACGNDQKCQGGVCISKVFPQNAYDPSITFADQLGSTSMTIAWDGSHYWSASGGGPGGTRLEQYDANGNPQAGYSPNIDFRSVFTQGGKGQTVFAREYGQSVIRVQTQPGGFANLLTLLGGNLDPQSAVVYNEDATEYIAMLGAAVTRWDANGNLIGTVTLAGYGNMNNENNYPQNRGVCKAGGYYLTYMAQTLSAWDGNGNRVKTTTLNGAGTSFDSYFSLSYAHGMVFIVDAAGGTWRGYDVGL